MGSLDMGVFFADFCYSVLKRLKKLDESCMLPIMSTEKPLITFHHVTTRIRDRKILSDTTWAIHDGDSWAMIGPNGSGKTSLSRLMIRELPVIHGTMDVRPDFDPGRDIAVVSFETQKRLFATESRKDDARHYSGHVLEFTSVKNVLESAVNDHPDAGRTDIMETARITSITHLLHRNITKLSTGEFRKVLVAKALLSKPRLLILDEPMEGLDAPSREQLLDFVAHLITEGVQVIFVTHRINTIPAAIRNIICLKDSRVVAQGQRDKISPEFIENLYGPQCKETEQDVQRLFSLENHRPGSEMIVMRDIHVRYGSLTVINGLSWTVMQGEKWMVQGSNGSGKSTLLSLIAGDNPQAYANEIYLFGQRRGSGESIWDIKKRIGLVSSEFQLRYQRDMTVFHVVLSGFFDSVGLYRKPSDEHKSTAHSWLSILGFEAKEDTLFTHLSFGEQKLVLIARAMVKSPELLILDEPCQGLDPVNRKKVLQLIETIGQIPETTMIYVTHHIDEALSCFNKVLCF